MSRKTFPPLTAWPAPDDMQSLGEAALIAETSRQTLERICNALTANPRARPKARNPQHIEVARLYANPAIGTTGTVQAGKIYGAMNMDISLMHTMQLPKAKAKIGQPKATAKATSPQTYGELMKVFGQTVARARDRDGPIPSRKIRDLYDRIAEVGPPPQGVLGGSPFHRIGRFVSLGDFMHRASAEDRWPFILPHKQTRPIDLLSATPSDWRRGELALLTMEEWHVKQAEGLAVESKLRSIKHNKKTAKTLDKGMAKGTPRERKWGVLRA